MVVQSSLGAGFRSLAASADQALKAGDHVLHSPHGRQPSRSGPGRHFLDELPDDNLEDMPHGGAPFFRRSQSQSRRGAHESSRPEGGMTLDRRDSSWSLPMSPAARFDDTPLPLEVEEQPEVTAAEEPHSCFPPPGRAWLYPDLPWGAPPMWQTKRMPGKTFLKAWDITTFLGCMYVAIMVPYLAGFIDRPDWGSSENETR